MLDSYLDQDIDRQTFLTKKSEILSQKSLEESLVNLQVNQNAWIEPMKKWLETAKSICCLLKSDDFDGQKVVLAEIFGSNLFLHNKTIIQTPTSASSKTTFRKGVESGFCLWQELKKVNQKIAQEGDNLDFYSEMVGGEGLEPSRYYYQQILSLQRLPIPPLALTLLF